METDTALMLYDGVCGFCNGTVKWVLARDKANKFRFAPLQSAIAEGILRRHGVDREQMIRSNSVYLVLNLDTPQEKLLVRSDVTVEVLRLLGGVWSLLGSIMGAIPRVLRDAGYRLMATNRFRIGGRLDACPIPSERDRTKFLGFDELGVSQLRLET